MTHMTKVFSGFFGVTNLTALACSGALTPRAGSQVGTVTTRINQIYEAILGVWN